MAYGAPPPYYGPQPGPAPAPYGTPPPASPPMMAPPPVMQPVVPVPLGAKPKPDGIMLIAVLEFVYAFIMIGYAGLFIWIGMVIMAATKATGSGIASGLGSAIGGVCMAFGAIYILFAVIFIVLAWGMMNIKPWARKFTIILMIISILLNLGGLASSYPAAVGIALLEIILAIVILVYLFKPSIKALFEPPPMIGPAPLMVQGQMPPAYGPPSPMYPPQAPPPGYPPQSPPPPY